ncbi:protein kinase family protein [Oceanobacillus sp. CAU 1775]
MSYKQLLDKFYGLALEEQLTIKERKGYLSNGLFYFTTNVENIETIHMEQTVIAYYLAENGYKQVALPIKNLNESWFSDVNGERFFVYEVHELVSDSEQLGTSLATLHKLGSSYPYEPKSISSYGEWKKLWIQKLTYIEESILAFSKTAGSPRNDILVQILPYIIGMSENAIQYLSETEEEETRYLESDQGTVTFLRFYKDSLDEVIWPDQFVYDHPVRDLAEYIRFLFLNNYSDHQVHEFLTDYQNVRPLSIFSLRLLYARLLYPIHLFDVIEDCLHENTTNEHFKTLYRLIELQANYEVRLQNFYEKVGINKTSYGLVEVDWL